MSSACYLHSTFEINLLITIFYNCKFIRNSSKSGFYSTANTNKSKLQKARSRLQGLDYNTTQHYIQSKIPKQNKNTYGAGAKELLFVQLSELRVEIGIVSLNYLCTQVVYRGRE